MENAAADNIQPIEDIPTKQANTPSFTYTAPRIDADLYQIEVPVFNSDNVPSKGIFSSLYMEYVWLSWFSIHLRCKYFYLADIEAQRDTSCLVYSCDFDRQDESKSKITNPTIANITNSSSYPLPPYPPLISLYSISIFICLYRVFVSRPVALLACIHRAWKPTG